jgi:hypothetical protein
VEVVNSYSLHQCFSTAGPWHLLGLGPHLIKNNLPGRGLTKVENHWSTRCQNPGDLSRNIHRLEHLKMHMKNSLVYVVKVQ